jgi:hypothetical protein
MAAAALVAFSAVGALAAKHLGEEQLRYQALCAASLRRAVVRIELHRRPHAWIAGSRIRSFEEGPWVKSIEEAVAEAERCVALFPARPDACYHLARGLLLLGRQGEAAAMLAKALEREAEFVPARVLLAEVRGEDQRPEPPPVSAPPGVKPWLEVWRARQDLRWRDAIAAYGQLPPRRGRWP